MAGNTNTPKAPEGFTFIKELGGISEYKLNSNDLRILLRHDDSAPVVTFMVTYLVGSRNEAVGHTGATHLLEHMMFKGTPTFNKEKGTQIAAVLEHVGAFLNATTWFDRTNYFELVSREHLELAMHIESDRMRNSMIRDEDRQPEMTVVRNEFDRGENDPENVLEDRILAHGYMAHPYHHSTIGWRADIEGVSTERLKEFYNTFYYPDNAMAVVIGSFDDDQVFALLQKYFGPIAKAPSPLPKVYTTEPPQQGEIRFEVNRAGQLGAVMIGHKTPQAMHADTYALDVLASVLSSGKTSRLYKSLIDKNLAINQSCTSYQFRDPAMLLTRATIQPGVDRKTVEATILAEMQGIIDNGVTERELEIAKGKVVARVAYDRDGTFAYAGRLNEAIASANWEFYITYLDNVNKITAADVQRVAKTYLDRMNRTVGYFIPLPPDAPSAGYNPDKPAPIIMNSQPLIRQAHQHHYRDPRDLQRWLENNPLAAGVVMAKFKDRIKRATLANGATVLALKTTVEQVISFRGALRAGTVFNPANNDMLASLTAQMLSLGTKQLDKFQFAEKLEEVGAQLNAGAGTFDLGLSGRCLKKDFPVVIDLMRQMLREPRFDAEEFDKLKKLQIARLQRQLENTSLQAGNELARNVFSKGHPYYEPPTQELIAQTEQTTLDDAKKFWAETFGGKSMTLVVVGDLDEKDTERLFDQAFGDWHGGKGFTPPPRVGVDTSPVRRVVTIKDKANIDVSFGHAGQVRLSDQDFFPMLIANRILGESTLSSRLGFRLRDTEGLTYGITSSLQASNRADGLWSIDMSLSLEGVERGLPLVKEEVEKFIAEGASEKEVNDEKTALVGSFNVINGFNSGALASQILTAEVENLGASYMDDYAKLVNSVTKAQVDEALRKYIHPDKMVTVLAGSIDENLQPLKNNKP
jgi:zinc protease